MDMPRDMSASHHGGTPAFPPSSIAVSLPPTHSAPIRTQPHSPILSMVKQERGSVSMISASLESTRLNRLPVFTVWTSTEICFDLRTVRVSKIAVNSLSLSISERDSSESDRYRVDLRKYIPSGIPSSRINSNLISPQPPS